MSESSLLDLAIPPKDPYAVRTSTRTVRRVTAVHVVNAQVRGATVSGMFELVAGVEHFLDVNDLRCVMVSCLWHNRTQPLLLDVGARATIIRNYSGEVVANIGPAPQGAHLRRTR